MKSNGNPSKKSAKQFKFEKDREGYSDRDIQMEILFSNWLIQDRTEKTRANTSAIVWVIVIGIGISILSVFV